MDKDTQDYFYRMSNDFTDACQTCKPDEYQARQNRLTISIAAFLIHMHQGHLLEDPLGHEEVNT